MVSTFLFVIFSFHHSIPCELSKALVDRGDTTVFHMIYRLNNGMKKRSNVSICKSVRGFEGPLGDYKFERCGIIAVEKEPYYLYVHACVFGLI